LNMTLILTCLTKDFIVQASDRRLTRTVGGKVELDDDDSNKALIYSNHFVFAYTGLAKLHDQYPSAIDWAAQRLSEKENIGDAVLHLGNQASDLMNSNHIRNFYSRSPASVKRLAFVGAGFADVEEDGRKNRRSLRIVISNFFRREDGTWPALPYRHFSVYYNWLPKNCDAELFVAGQQLPKKRHIEFTRFLRQCVRHKVKPETFGRLLMREIRAVAEKNDYVGKNIMCTFVPRAFADGVAGSVRYHFGGVLLQSPVVSTEPQRLEPVEVVSDENRFVLLPPFDDPRFVYIDRDGKAMPYHGAVYAGPGYYIPPITMHGASLAVPPVVQVPGPPVDTPL